LAPISKRKWAELEAKGEPVPSSSMKQSARKRRDHDVVTRNDRDEWHELVCRSRWCVKDCGRRAGPHGHHAIEKSLLLDHPRLRDHAWDLEDGIAVCALCHSRHTAAVDPITRDELIAAGYWQTLTDWARMLDARYFPDGHEPALSRLEHDYPAGATRRSGPTNEGAD
jgi:hypothetical protein